jgi:hypothetical protein
MGEWTKRRCGLSRRDNRTQPGVLTPGGRIKDGPALKGRQKLIPHIDRNPLHGTTFYRPVRAAFRYECVLGLKPQAKSCYPFGIKFVSPLRPFAHSPTRPFASGSLPRARRCSRCRCRQRNHRQTAVGLPGITTTVSSLRGILKIVFPIDC